MIGGALVLVIGSDETALWIVFPFAVLVAAYSPGTAPFAVGQAAFTVLISILFNLIVPVGWKVGVVRIEDVALGCAVSAVIGTLFWRRGVSSVVGDDLADAFRAGASYLTQAVQWATGARAGEPDTAMPAGTAGVRLDEGLRGFLSEQGSKRIAKQDLWRLVGGSLRLRLTAQRWRRCREMPPVWRRHAACSSAVPPRSRRGTTSSPSRSASRITGPCQSSGRHRWPRRGSSISVRLVLRRVAMRAPRSPEPAHGRSRQARGRGREPPQTSLVALRPAR